MNFQQRNVWRELESGCEVENYQKFRLRQRAALENELYLNGCIITKKRQVEHTQ